MAAANTHRAAGYIDPQKKKLYGASKKMMSQVLAILDEYQAHEAPMTCRQIYYRMIGEYKYPKGKAFNEALSRILIDGRRREEIPFSSIRDDGLLGGGSWSWDLRAHLRDCRYWVMNSYTLDKQQNSESRIEVWCEAAGMLPQLAKAMVSTRELAFR